MLSESVVYKRAVGYFTSGWIARNSVGLARLASNGGRAQWVTSPHLSESDWNALEKGSSSDYEVIERLTLFSVEELAAALAKDTLETLAWMVADGILEFRIALPQSNPYSRDFHSKVGVFCDASGPAVAFIGSMNETARGAVNHEVISTYTRSRGETERIEHLNSLFEMIWAGEDEHYKTYPLPDVVEKRIVQFSKGARPYASPAHEETRPHRAILRDYQLEALEAWLANDKHGILEMATGTGKTKTAIACIENVLEDKNAPLLVVVACPFQHLVDQWADELQLMGVETVRAHGASKKWRPELHRMINRMERGAQVHGFVVTTYTTLTSDYFRYATEPLQDSIMFVADECHYLGSPKSLSAMNERYPFRLGLSATPTRHYDAGGTEAIVNFFRATVFKYDMAQAIESGFLVPYYYYPEFIELTEAETDEYVTLSEQISRLMSYDTPTAHEQAVRLAIRRARVLNNAEAKLDWLKEHLSGIPVQDWEYTLVYSGDAIFSETTNLIGRQLGIRQHEFTSRQSRSQRSSILERFQSRDLQMLSAMRCLDEGVDVPPTRRAYFLASSGNPREFVQRRGRILRPAPGKLHATIHDAIAIPVGGISRTASGWKATQAALRGQLRRIEEFSSLALNRVQADDAVFDFRLKFDLPLSQGEEVEYEQF